MACSWKRPFSAAFAPDGKTYAFEPADEKRMRLYFEALVQGTCFADTAAEGAADLDMDEPTATMTSFCIGDVVHCRHGLDDQCAHCVGRVVQNVPLFTYCAWCRTCEPCSPAAEFALARLRASELSYPALLALAADLRLGSDHSRVLHSGSGRGYTAVAWAALFPHLAITCLEQSWEAHTAAVHAVSRSESSVQQRVKLFCCDPLDAGDVSEANIMVVSTSGFDDIATARLHVNVQSLPPSARVVLLSQEGPRDVSSGLALHRFVLTHQAYYRTRAGGNLKAQVFLKI